MTRKMQQNRRVRLFSLGLYSVEASALKSVPMQVPYLKNFINDRIRLKRRAIREGWSVTELKRAIRLSYEAKTGLQRGQKIDKATIFKMLRIYEADWHNTAPDDELQKWVSPSAKTSHHTGSFNREKALRAKRVYNQRPEVKAKRAKYRATHRTQIAEAERLRRAFIRNNNVSK